MQQGAASIFEAAKPTASASPLFERRDLQDRRRQPVRQADNIFLSCVEHQYRLLRVLCDMKMDRSLILTLRIVKTLSGTMQCFFVSAQIIRSTGLVKLALQVEPRRSCIDQKQVEPSFGRF